MNIQTSLPYFVQGMVLQSSHLNDLVQYLEQQDRRSRNTLTGIGVVCGFDVDVTADAEVAISKGVAVTSEGFLIAEDAGTFDRVRPYAAPAPSGVEATEDTLAEARYAFLFPNGEDQIEAWELLPADFQPAPGEADPTILTADFLDRMTVMLYLECDLEALKNCTLNDCSDKGAELQFTLRRLLVSREDADAMMAREAEIAGRPTDLANHPRLGLPHIRVEKLNLGRNNVSTFQFLALRILQIAFRLGAELPDAMRNAYAAYDYLLEDMFPESRFPNGPIHQNLFNNAWGNLARNLFLIQYFYDFMLDLAQAYNEFAAAGARFDAECKPNEARFPRHVLIGDVVQRPVAFGADIATPADFVGYDPLAASTGFGPSPRPAERRTHFCPSPAVSDGGARLEELRSLFYRLTLLAHTYDTRGRLEAPIRITPSRDREFPLSEQAIPYHYAHNRNRDLFRNWSYRKTKSNLLSTVYSYSFSAPTANHPLWYRLDDQNFYRIEGVVGKSLGTAMATLIAWKKALGLSFSIEAVWTPLGVAGDATSQAVDQQAQARALQAVTRLLLCRMRDLDVIFLMAMAAIFAFLVWLIQRIGGQNVGRFAAASNLVAAPANADTSQPQPTLELLRAARPLSASLFSAEGFAARAINLSLEDEAKLRRESDQLLTRFRTTTIKRGEATKTLVKDADAASLAGIYERTSDPDAGGELFDRVRSHVATLDLDVDVDRELVATRAYAGVSALDKAERLMETLKAPSVAEFDVDRFSTAFRGFADSYQAYAAVAPTNAEAVGQPAAEANLAIKANAPSIAAQTNVFSAANILGELQKRVLSLFLDLTLAGASRKHPELEHKAGVRVGGTLLLAYASKLEFANLLRRNAVAVDGFLTAARPNATTGAFTSAFDGAITELTSASAARTEDPLDDFVVLADFCLPYLCCDADCSDVELGRIQIPDPFAGVDRPGPMAVPPVIPGTRRPSFDFDRLRDLVGNDGGGIPTPVGGLTDFTTRPDPRPADPDQPSPPEDEPTPPPITRTGALSGAVVVEQPRGVALPARGAVVTLTGDGIDGRRSISAADGTFSGALTPGTYRAIAALAGHTSTTETFEITAGRTTAVRISLRATTTEEPSDPRPTPTPSRTGTVSGTAFIQPTSGRATLGEGAVVTISGDDMAARERIPTENGAFTLDLPPGAYQAIATLRGHRGQSQTFEIRAGETTTLRLPLTPTG